MTARMDDAAQLAHRAEADPRPRSAVSHGAGLSGLIGVLAWIGFARHFGMDGPYSAL
ncbi:hypothetical protein QFZ54_002944 [Sphingomonas faeni]|nr:hypothetical protein [Sphingomonas faeni]